MDSKEEQLVKKIIVAGLGDSITAGAPGWDPDVSRRGPDGNDEQSQYLYWAAKADPRIEFRNHGVCTERTDQIAARLDVAADGADVLVVQGGINDIVHDQPVDAAAENLREMVRRGKSLGLGVVLANVLPWNNGGPTAEPRIRQLNELIRAIGEEEGVKVLPFHETLEDPETPGRMRSDWTAEGNHPSVAGHRRLGELAFALPTEEEQREVSRRATH
jgi:lysophospholipase L1-like esterase